MAIGYRIYRNDGAGGPIDYTTPYATTTATSITLPAVAPGSNYLYAVRAYDTVTGYEESNATAVAPLVTSASGADITRVPNAPAGAWAEPRGADGALVRWTYQGGMELGVPAGFRVYANAGSSVNWALAPKATVPRNVRDAYRADITGLPVGTNVAVGVEAYNAVGSSRAPVLDPIIAGPAIPAPVSGPDGTTTSSIE